MGMGVDSRLIFSNVINPLYKWVLFIWVYYGTALWQVGDSSEQNGEYNIVLVKGKEVLFKKKKTKLMTHTIELYEISILNLRLCTFVFLSNLQ